MTQPKRKPGGPCLDPNRPEPKVVTITFPHEARRNSLVSRGVRMLNTVRDGQRMSVREVAEFLGINRVTLHAAVRSEAARKAQTKEGWFCLCCGRPILSGPAHKMFCKPGCRANYHRNEARLDARVRRLCAAWAAGDLEYFIGK